MINALGELLRQVADWFAGGTGAWSTTIYVALAFVVAFLCDRICKFLIQRILLPIIRRTKFEWDDHLYDKNVISRLAALAPAIILYIFLPSAFEDGSGWQLLTDRICRVYIIALILRFINGILRAFNDILSERENLRHYPIKGSVQTVQVIVFCIGFICIIGTIIDQSPARLFAGLGASTAVLMLVFQDTILSFVAGIQLSANNMVRKGDWITSPTHHANGYVKDISLHTIKVQNFDNSTTTITPYALMTGSFTNWRSMFESGGRRIKRQILLDVNSITFLDEEALNAYKRNELVGPFVKQRLQAIEKARSAADFFKLEELRVTNSMLFRNYLEAYIRQMGNANPELLYMARYLPMEDKGLPVELYLYSAEKSWKEYEGILADLLDYTLAVTAEFGLRIYQAPSSYDIQSLRSKS